MRIVIADDHTLFRQGISALLSLNPDIQVIAEASNATEAVEQCTELRPDVVLMGINMIGLSSFEATRQIRKTCPQTKVLFVSPFNKEDYLTEAMESGASGYLARETRGTQLIAAIAEVAQGGTYLSPRMLSNLLDDFSGRAKGPSKLPRTGPLTRREVEILKSLAEGRSVKDVAGILGLSVKTVEAHKFNLMRKLDIHNKAQLVHYAVQKKIIELAVVA
jgi:two-component system, NarL family, response regulator NreC